MNLSIGILFLLLVSHINGLKPKHLRGKYSDQNDNGFVDLPMTPDHAVDLGWLRPPEDRFFAPFITFCDSTSPLVCITYNPNFEIIKIATIPSKQHGIYSALQAATHSYEKAYYFGNDVYESRVWLLDPLQLKDNNFTVPDSKYIWGPIQSKITRIEPNAIGMQYVNLLTNQFCFEKMGNHYARSLMDPVLYITDPYTGELIGWESVFLGANVPKGNDLLDDNASFVIQKADSALLNKELNNLVSTVFSAFHVFLVPDPYTTTCPKSLNAIVHAYDKERMHDDSNYETIYRKGGIADPADFQHDALLYFERPY